MIKRRIPEKYEFDALQLTEVIYQALGRKFPISISDRIITLDDNFTTQELQTIKTAVMNLLTEITDLTM